MLTAGTLTEVEAGIRDGGGPGGGAYLLIGLGEGARLFGELGTFSAPGLCRPPLETDGCGLGDGMGMGFGCIGFG